MYKTPQRKSPRRIRDLTDEPSWLRSQGRVVDQWNPVATPSSLRDSDIRRQIIGYPDLTGEPTWLQSAGRKFHGRTPVKTPRNITNDLIMAQIKARQVCKVTRCSAKTKAGKACKKCTSKGNTRCSLHKRKR